MAKYAHPSREKGTVLIRGVKFVDGVTEEVTVSESTAQYFERIGIKEVKPRQAAKESKEK